MLQKFFYKIIEGRRPNRAFAGKLLHGIGAAVVNHALVAVFLQTAHHVGAHSADTDHAKLHSFAPVVLLLTLMDSSFDSCTIRRTPELLGWRLITFHLQHLLAGPVN